MSSHADINERGAWLMASRQQHKFDEALAAELASFFAAQSATVLDMGCGPGDYVRLLNERHVQASGVDGNPNTSHFNAACQVADLTEPQELGRFDWVLSLEVGEHIPQRWMPGFISNLHVHNQKGIILSWAVPDQPGYGHVNCRSNEDVEQLFAELRFGQGSAGSFPGRVHTAVVQGHSAGFSKAVRRLTMIPRQD